MRFGAIVSTWCAGILIAFASDVSLADSQWMDPPMPEVGVEFGIGVDFDGFYNVGGVVCSDASYLYG